MYTHTLNMYTDLYIYIYIYTQIHNPCEVLDGHAGRRGLLGERRLRVDHDVRVRALRGVLVDGDGVGAHGDRGRNLRLVRARGGRGQVRAVMREVGGVGRRLPGHGASELAGVEVLVREARALRAGAAVADRQRDRRRLLRQEVHRGLGVDDEVGPRVLARRRRHVRRDRHDVRPERQAAAELRLVGARGARRQVGVVGHDVRHVRGRAPRQGASQLHQVQVLVWEHDALHGRRRVGDGRGHGRALLRQRGLRVHRDVRPRGVVRVAVEALLVRADLHRAGDLRPVEARGALGEVDLVVRHLGDAGGGRPRDGAADLPGVEVEVRERDGGDALVRVEAGDRRRRRLLEERGLRVDADDVVRAQVVVRGLGDEVRAGRRVAPELQHALVADTWGQH